MSGHPAQPFTANCGAKGCEHPRCKAAHRRYRRDLKRDLRRGVTRRTGVEPVSAWVRALRVDWEVSQQQIAAVAGVCRTTVWNAERRARTVILCDNADAILAVTGEMARRSPAGHGFCPSVKLLRRLQAAAWLGWDDAALSALARRHGYRSCQPYIVAELREYAAAGREIWVSTARTFQAVLQEIGNQAGPSPAVAAAARAAGYLPPAAWDGDYDTPDPLEELEPETVTEDGIPLDLHERRVWERERVAVLAGRQLVDAEIAVAIQRSTRQVTRIRSAYGIPPGLPCGVTRRQERETA